MPPNRAHVLHTISAKAKIIVSPVLLTTHSEALHNGVPNAAATLELLNRFHCDLGYRHLHTMSGASLWQCSPHVALKQPRTQGGGWRQVAGLVVALQVPQQCVGSAHTIGITWVWLR